MDVPPFGSHETEESLDADESSLDNPEENESSNDNPEENEASNEVEDDPSEEEMEEERELLKSAFHDLGDDLNVLIRGIKPHILIRDMKMIDPGIFNRFFRGFRPDKIGRGRMVRILTPEIREKDNLKVMQLLTLHWNNANDPVFKAMRKLVATINPEVEEIEKIEDEQASNFVSQLKETGFKRDKIHICVQLNGVRFSKEFIASHLSPNSETSS